MRRDDPAAPRQWHGVHKALADPLRIRLVEMLWDAPRSARELADCIGVPADRLYYHLGQLEGAGLIKITEYRQLARGKVERVYAPAVAEPPGDAASPEEVAAFLGSVLDATRADISAAYEAKEAGQRREVTVVRSTFRLTEEALAELRDCIEQIAARFGDPGGSGPGSVWTRVVIALADLQDRPAPGGGPSQGRLS